MSGSGCSGHKARRLKADELAARPWARRRRDRPGCPFAAFFTRAAAPVTFARQERGAVGMFVAAGSGVCMREEAVWACEWPTVRAGPSSQRPIRDSRRALAQMAWE